jgi:heat shock protein 4
MVMHLFVTSIQIGPLPESDGSKAVFEVIFQLNLHGIVNIESSTVSKKPNFNLSILHYQFSKRSSYIHEPLICLQLIENHMEDSVTTRDNHSNSDAMDVEPISETDQNVNEHSINQKSGSPHSSVSAFLMKIYL